MYLFLLRYDGRNKSNLSSQQQHHADSDTTSHYDNYNDNHNANYNYYNYYNANHTTLNYPYTAANAATAAESHTSGSDSRRCRGGSW
jgi:hypothetical protein